MTERKILVYVLWKSLAYTQQKVESDGALKPCLNLSFPLDISVKWASQAVLVLKNWPANAWPLEEEMATHSSILTWRFPWTKEPGGLQSMGSQRVEHDWSNLESTEASEPGNPRPFHHSSRGRPRSVGCGKSFTVHHPAGMSLHLIHGFQMNRSTLVFITFKKWVCVSHA